MATVNETVSVDFKVEIAKLKRQLRDAQNETKKTTKFMQKEWKNTGAALTGVTAALTLLVKTGLEYNKQVEQTVNGLASLNAATSQNVDSMGNHVSATQKFAMAQKEAVGTMKELEAINAKTPHTLNQTAQIYKTMYASMKSAGVTSSEMVGITEQLSIASGAAGIQFQQLLSGVDGLATGTVLANSELGRFLNSIGLTNDKLKNSTDLVKTFQETLGDFQTADTMEVAVSNLTNAFNNFAGAVTSDLFGNAKLAINKMSDALNLVNEGFNRARILEGSIYELETIDELNQRRVQQESELNRLKLIMISFNTAEREAEYKALDFQHNQVLSLIEIKQREGRLLATQAKTEAQIKAEKIAQEKLDKEIAKQKKIQADEAERQLKAVAETIAQQKAFMQQYLPQLFGGQEFYGQPANNASATGGVTNNYYNNNYSGTTSVIQETQQEFDARKRKTPSYSGANSIAGTGYQSIFGESANAVRDIKDFAKNTGAVAQAFNQITISLEEYESALQVLQDALSDISEVFNDLKSVINIIGKDLLQSAKDKIYGRDAQTPVSFESALLATKNAIDALNADTTNVDLAKAYKTESDKLLKSLSYLDDSTRFASKAQQDFEKARAVYEISKLDDARQDAVEEADKNLEALEAIRDAINGGSGKANNLREALLGAGSVAEKIQAGNDVLGITGANKMIQEYQKEVAEGQGRYKVLNTYDKIDQGGGNFVFGVTEATYTPYKNGGYTGNMGVDEQAGVVHGREYVVNAQTTKDLGLNGQGGMFEAMASHLYEINKTTKKSLSVDRQILDNQLQEAV